MKFIENTQMIEGVEIKFFLFDSMIRNVDHEIIEFLIYKNYKFPYILCLKNRPHNTYEIIDLSIKKYQIPKMFYRFDRFEITGYKQLLVIDIGETIKNKKLIFV